MWEMWSSKGKKRSKCSSVYTVTSNFQMREVIKNEKAHWKGLSTKASHRMWMSLFKKTVLEPQSWYIISKMSSKITIRANSDKQEKKLLGKKSSHTRCNTSRHNNYLKSETIRYMEKHVPGRNINGTFKYSC